MGNPASLHTELAEHWLFHAAHPSYPANENEISAFEQRYEVCFPTDLREYVRTLNGMVNEPDDGEFRFVPLIQMCPETDLSVTGSAGKLLFVDYLQLCYWYCIELDRQKKETTRVFLGGTLDENRVVANSLTDFFRAYIENRTSLMIRGRAT
jgi:hypothetical protein